MSPLQDPFYIVKEEIQESIDKLQATFRQWKQTPSNTGEGVHLTRELLTSCESIEWQVDELEKAITVASRDPAWYGLNEVELEKRRKWTRNAYNQVGTVKRTIEAGKEQSPVNSGVTRKELMRLPNDSASQAGRPHHYINQDNDDFISSESDQQQLLIKKQDEELDELSASVRRIGDVGLTIHDELIGQERILDELGMEMETTSNRLGFVQKSESYRKTTFVSAEKSCNGDEEGRCQGPNHVASILTCAIYSSFYVGIFHLKNNCRFAQPDALRYIVFLWIIFEVLSGLQIPTSVRFI